MSKVRPVRFISCSTQYRIEQNFDLKNGMISSFVSCKIFSFLFHICRCELEIDDVCKKMSPLRYVRCMFAYQQQIYCFNYFESINFSCSMLKYKNKLMFLILIYSECHFSGIKVCNVLGLSGPTRKVRRKPRQSPKKKNFKKTSVSHGEGILLFFWSGR